MKVKAVFDATKKHFTITRADMVEGVDCYDPLESEDMARLFDDIVTKSKDFIHVYDAMKQLKSAMCTSYHHFATAAHESIRGADPANDLLTSYLKKKDGSLTILDNIYPIFVNDSNRKSRALSEKFAIAFDSLGEFPGFKPVTFGNWDRFLHATGKGLTKFSIYNSYSDAKEKFGTVDSKYYKDNPHVKHFHAEILELEKKIEAHRFTSKIKSYLLPFSCSGKSKAFSHYRYTALTTGLFDDPYLKTYAKEVAQDFAVLAVKWCISSALTTFLINPILSIPVAFALGILFVTQVTFNENYKPSFSITKDVPLAPLVSGFAGVSFQFSAWTTAPAIAIALIYGFTASVSSTFATSSLEKDMIAFEKPDRWIFTSALHTTLDITKGVLFAAASYALFKKFVVPEAAIAL